MILIASIATKNSTYVYAYMCTYTHLHACVHTCVCMYVYVIVLGVQSCLLGVQSRFSPLLHRIVSSIITGPWPVSFTAASLVPRTGPGNRSGFVESAQTSDLNERMTHSSVMLRRSPGRLTEAGLSPGAGVLARLPCRRSLEGPRSTGVCVFLAEAPSAIMWPRRSLQGPGPSSAA